jgi:hypothetical protein
MSFKRLFRVSLDDSGFQQVFESFEEKLNRHEQLILELQRLLQDRPSRQDLELAKVEIRKEFDGKLQALEKTLLSKVDSRCDLLSSAISTHLARLGELDELAVRLRSFEDLLATSNRSNAQLQSYVKVIADSYGQISNSAVSLDSSLDRQLGNSTEFITTNFHSVFANTAQLREDLEKLKQTVKAPIKIEPKQAGHRREPERAPTPPPDPTPAREAEAPRGAEIDISDLHPLRRCHASWNDPPELPELSKFESLRDSVAYIYELHARLQGILDAMHGRLLVNASEICGMVDRGAFEGLLEKLRGAIGDMEEELGELRRSLTRNLTRSEVLQMINEAISVSANTQTAVGTMRCIACGKESRQVAGATGEGEATRRLGTPPNRLALLTIAGAGRVSEMYSSPEQLQPGIESPMAMRPFRASYKVARQAASKPPSK